MTPPTRPARRRRPIPTAQVVFVTARTPAGVGALLRLDIDRAAVEAVLAAPRPLAAEGAAEAAAEASASPSRTAAALRVAEQRVRAAGYADAVAFTASAAHWLLRPERALPLAALSAPHP